MKDLNMLVWLTQLGMSVAMPFIRPPRFFILFRLLNRSAIQTTPSKYYESL